MHERGLLKRCERYRSHLYESAVTKDEAQALFAGESPEVPAAKQEAGLVSPKSKTPVSAEPTGGQATNGNPGATPAAMPAPTAENVSAKE